MRNISIITLIILLSFVFLRAAYITNLETAVTQPDGTILHCLASGDEFYNWLHDNAGFTIIQSQDDGYFYYAVRDGDLLRPSEFRVNQIDPAAAGIEPFLKIAPALIRQKAAAYNSHLREDIRPATLGLLNNIAVFIRFSDQEEFERSRAAYDSLFNDTSPGTLSLQSYYDEVSYDQLELVTYHYPECEPSINLSYQDEHPRNYFLPYHPINNPIGYSSWNKTEREHTLLVNAVEFIADQVPPELNVDYNNDGYVDNVCFIIRGVHSAWADLLWAHRWFLYSYYVDINGYTVGDYTFQPENQVSVRILSHEMFHALGAPDLYHYGFDGIAPAGPWDIMESGFVHMGAHMKYKYGQWLEEIPEITSSGFYTLQPLASGENCCFQILSPYSYEEYFVLEYRQRDPGTYDRNVPGSGLLVYRINSSLYGNAQGPPDEVYIYRVNGTENENGSLVQAYFCQEQERTEINDFTNPSSFLSSGMDGGLNINQIGIAGEDISFYVDMDPLFIPPLCVIAHPAADVFLPCADLLIEVAAQDVFFSVDRVELTIDGNPVTVFYSEPYSYLWELGGTELGSHTISATAFSTSGMNSTDINQITLFDPEDDTWLIWYTDNPEYAEFGRGCIPIKAAVDFDLGSIEFFVKKVSLNIVPDPYGTAPNPGEVYCEIVRLDETGITEEVLLEVGSFVTPMEGRYVHDVNSTTTISGKIALIMDISSYQNMLFDALGVNSHSWLTEPDRPWVDALSRGILGAADIAIMISSNPVANDDDWDIPQTVTLYRSHPNPFVTGTGNRDGGVQIGFYLPSAERISLDIYNVKGQKVISLLPVDRLLQGEYTVNWNGKDEQGRTVSSGIYLYILRTDSVLCSRKMTLIR
ncbi:MAG: M6 family metalloprotease domain-containing protein [Candidatus Cloacimonetes bacterium]|nr:M6 family metalloprotease domain-containing protein [Candidatus Cloacimonadota bacterium]